MRDKLEGTEMWLIHGQDTTVDKASRETALATAQQWLITNANRIKAVTFEDEEGKTPATMADLCEAISLASTEALTKLPKRLWIPFEDGTLSIKLK